MVWMSRAYLLLLLISAASGQKAPDVSEKAPPKVEAALRARVNQFCKYMVDGKFRLAESLVADESKDYYFNGKKPRYTAFSIKRIEYSDNFTRATVVVSVDKIVPFPGFQGQPITEAVPSRWKLEKGLWCWYTVASNTRALPMAMPGLMPQAGGMMVPTGPGAPPPIPNMTALVQADKAAVELKPAGPSSAQVTLVNRLKSPVTLMARDPNVAGLSVKLDRANLKADEKAILDVQWSGVSAPTQPVTMTIVVRQTNQIIPIKIAFGEATKP
jgi:hypothetical protein